MNQIALLIIELMLCFTTAVILYKYYKTEGLYTYTIIAMILTCLMSLKTITIYSYNMNLGIIPFITIFTMNNIMIQKKGPNETKTHLLTLIATTVITYTILILVSKMAYSREISIFTSASYDNIFDNSLRLIFANIVTILYTLILNTKLYYYLKIMKNNILISNLFTTIIIQFIASLLFGIIAYTFTLDFIDIIKIIMIRYLISLIVGFLSTTIIYVTKYIKEQ